MSDAPPAIDAPTRGTRRARWGMLAVVVVMAGALVATGILTWVDHRAAADAVAETRAIDLLRAVRRNLRDAADPLTEVGALLEDFGEAGLRYVALVSRRGEVVAEAGQARGALEARDWGPGPGAGGGPGGREPRPVRVGGRLRFDAPVAPGRGGGRLQPRLVIEVEPVAAEGLEERARNQLVVSAVAASVLLVIGLVFWRWGVRQDLTEALLARNRRLAALGEMSAVLGHEIRNPLASLKGHAQLVVERLEPEARARKSAERVVLEAERLERLTAQVLDFARTGSINREAHDPAEVLRRAVEATGGERVRVDTTRAPAIWSLDGTRMQQVLVNLLENALAASPPDAAVEARCAGDEVMLRYTIRDHGEGFPPGELDQVFEPFRTHRIHGTGLGLAIARRIVEAHGGGIRAANAEGGGAIVTVTVPVPARTHTTGGA
ncbi:MAG: two-component sensor histidine kinase [Deltaproteobacteria bacterium]|nr:two-component sensor histidine kinase [Deltaproteobacteria bacterium]